MNDEMRILVAFDGSVYAENAIDEMSRAGLPRNAQALLVYVQERWLPMPKSARLKTDDKAVNSSTAVAAQMARADEDLEVIISSEQLEGLEQGKKQLQTHFPNWKIETLILEGSPSSQINQKAKEWNADLIVVGCQGQTENKLHTVGSISQKIANEAPCSVRIVRGQVWKQGSPNRILIGLDGTEATEVVVQDVAERMWLMGSEVRLVMATDRRPNQEETQAREEEQIWIENCIAKARKILEDTELNVTELVEEGNPKEVIVNAADEWGADCIFIGANKRLNYFENLLLGSVSTAVVARANCTVEVVR